jgi:hypothetical protein
MPTRNTLKRVRLSADDTITPTAQMFWYSTPLTLSVSALTAETIFVGVVGDFTN